MPTDTREIVALRRDLAQAERALREQAERKARRLVEAGRIAWREAQDACFSFDRIRQSANTRLKAIQAGDHERFRGERQLAEKALRDADRADAGYALISFARRGDRLRYLRSEIEREAVIAEALQRGGVYTDACRGRYFQEIVR